MTVRSSSLSRSNSIPFNCPRTSTTKIDLRSTETKIITNIHLISMHKEVSMLTKLLEIIHWIGFIVIYFSSFCYSNTCETVQLCT